MSKLYQHSTHIIDNNAKYYLPADTEIVPYLNTLETDLIIDANSQDITISVTSNIAWHINVGSSWLSTTKTSYFGDATLTIHTEENTDSTTDTRSIRISITPDDTDLVLTLSKHRYIYQSKPTVTTVPYLTVSGLTMSDELGNDIAVDKLYCTGGSYARIDIKTNTSWVATVDNTKFEAGVSYLPFLPTSGIGDGYTFVSTTSQASTTSENTGVLTITGTLNSNTITKTINLVQGVSPYITVTPSYIEISKDGGSYSLSISTNGSWSIDNDSVSNALPNSGSGDSTTTITIAPYTGQQGSGRNINIAVNVSLNGGTTLAYATVKQYNYYS